MADTSDTGACRSPKPCSSGRHPVLSFLRRGIEMFTGPWTWSNLFSWIGIIALIFFIKGCVIDQYTIPSGSMEPTLRGDPRFFRGDRVLVNKWLFGPRIPFTTVRLWRWGTPERWDIVVFRAVDPNAAHPILIKRVIGLPGERVHISDGKIWINGEVVAPPPPLDGIVHYTDSIGLDPLELKRQLLILAQRNSPLPSLNPDNVQVQILYTDMQRLHPSVAALDIESLGAEDVETLCAQANPTSLVLLKNLYVALGPQMEYGINEAPEFSVVPEGHYLLLGDNSAQSLDGRMYGWVPHNHLYGRTFAVWWPWSRRQDFTGFSGTWWGMFLLYGIPLFFIALEIFLALRHKSRV